MARGALGLSVLAVVLSAGLARAQWPGPQGPGPAVGHPQPVGDLFGYSPLVPSVNPFPSRTSGYAQSIFSPMGGKRIEPLPPPRHPSVIVLPVVPCAPCVPYPPGEPAVIGPVVWAVPAQGLQRFAR